MRLPTEYVATLLMSVLMLAPLAALELRTGAPDPGPLTSYDVQASYDPATGILQAEAIIRFVNTADVAVPYLAFQCHPNADFYGSGSRLTITQVQTAQGDDLPWRMNEKSLALLVELPAPLATKATYTLRLAWTANLPENAGRAGLFNRDGSRHSFYSWYPEPAVFRQGAWQLPELPIQSDPSVTAIHNMNMSLKVPALWQLAAAGHEQQPRAGQPWLVEAIAVRNVTFALLKDQLVSEAFTKAAEPVRVRVYHDKAVPTERVTLMREAAVSSLELFERVFGPYPYDELDIVLVPLYFGVGGMEASGLVFINDDLLVSDAAAPLASLPGLELLDSLALVTVHEVAHQWWYGVVGNNTRTDPWLDEPITEWSTIYWVEQQHGPDAARTAATRRFAPMANIIGTPFEKPVRIDAKKMGLMGFGLNLYGKGPLMYSALRHRLGDERFFALVRQWYQRNYWGMVSSVAWDNHFLADFDAQFREQFIRYWLDGTGVVDPIIGELIFPFGGLADLINKAEQDAAAE